VRVLCYNVLAEKYAVPELLSYCPMRYLRYDHRKQQILREILSFDCDFVALQVKRVSAGPCFRSDSHKPHPSFQEVEAGHFKTYFEPQMSKAGFSGTFRPKSRARTMMDSSSVDGCVLFYKKEKFVDRPFPSHHSPQRLLFDSSMPGSKCWRNSGLSTRAIQLSATRESSRGAATLSTD